MSCCSKSSSSEEKSGKTNDLVLLKNWLTHDTVDFHRFDDEVERTAFQNDLLDWYRTNRRKLPWRGDPPPWTGSTAHFAIKGKASKMKRLTNHPHHQTKLSSFLDGSSHPNQETKQKCTTLGSTTLPVQVEPTRTYPITPYGIWVSEIMLQQTRVEAVVEKWCRWMDSFPTVSALASATPDQVNAHWAGLGFYRRARLLHQAAGIVVHQCYAVVPNTVDALMALPGIGRYTASAIVSVAFGTNNTPVVDGNVCRVLSRMRAISEHIKAPSFKDKYAWGIAESLVQDCIAPGDLNQAIMELGATYCAPSGTGVDPDDPVHGRYWSVELQRQVATHRRQGGSYDDLDMLISKHSCPLCTTNAIRESLQLMWEATATAPEHTSGVSSFHGHTGFPLAPPEAKKREEVLVVAVLRSGNRWLLTRRPEQGLLGGQWEFPNQCIWQSDGKVSNKPNIIPEFDASHRRRVLVEFLSTILTANITWHQRLTDPMEHVFSHIRHTMWIECGEISETTTMTIAPIDLVLQKNDSSNTRWMCEQDMAKVGVTSGVKKIMAAVQQSTQVKKRKR